jgi:hypothetical protein
MGVWIVAAMAFVVGAGVVARRFRERAAPHIDVGDVSASWLREQRADKRQDRY